MSYWIVRVNYDPGTPVEFAVTGATNYRQAEDTVLRHIGYNPGVPLSSMAVEGFPPSAAKDHTLEYRRLSRSETFDILYND